MTEIWPDLSGCPMKDNVFSYKVVKFLDYFSWDTDITLILS